MKAAQFSHLLSFLFFPLTLFGVESNLATLFVPAITMAEPTDDTAEITPAWGALPAEQFLIVRLNGIESGTMGLVIMLTDDCV